MSLTTFFSLSSPSIILDAYTAALAWRQYSVRSAARHNLRSILGPAFAARHNAQHRMRRETLNRWFLTLASKLPPPAALRKPSNSATVDAARRHRALTAQTLGTFATEAEGLRRVSARPFFVLVLWLWGFRGIGEYRAQSICGVSWWNSALTCACRALPISHLFQR
ncbi:hypothetical protein B0H14DRAFT_3443910 [Mycena olivaceomarginata]|nr:hypothetical protein B0H14DRAFT_3443910 [Mycena olivaceomarginata]